MAQVHLFCLVDEDGEVYGPAATREECLDLALREWIELAADPADAGNQADVMTTELLKGSAAVVRVTVQADSSDAVAMALYALGLDKA